MRRSAVRSVTLVLEQFAASIGGRRASEKDIAASKPRQETGLNSAITISSEAVSGIPGRKNAWPDPCVPPFRRTPGTR
jgi:hypothetical protein